MRANLALIPVKKPRGPDSLAMCKIMPSVDNVVEVDVTADDMAAADVAADDMATVGVGCS